MRQGTFTPLVILGLDFVSWICIKNFQTFLEVKIEINGVILTPCPAHWVLQKLPLGSSKVEHFSCFVIPCQTGLRRVCSTMTQYWEYHYENSGEKQDFYSLYGLKNCEQYVLFIFKQSSLCIKSTSCQTTVENLKTLPMLTLFWVLWNETINYGSQLVNGIKISR